eukprot:SAG31_NODE_569_length_14020_cov_11.049565_5_plen_184_part_00
MRANEQSMETEKTAAERQLHAAPGSMKAELAEQQRVVDLERSGNIKDVLMALERAKTAVQEQLVAVRANDMETEKTGAEVKREQNVRAARSIGSRGGVLLDTTAPTCSGAALSVPVAIAIPIAIISMHALEMEKRQRAAGLAQSTADRAAVQEQLAAIMRANEQNMETEKTGAVVKREQKYII